MATVRIYYEEAADDLLPPVCARCGKPSTTSKRKTFSWHPPWVIVTIIAGLLPYVIVALILTKRMRVNVPFCDDHRNHWLSRTLVTTFGFVVLAMGGILGIVLTGQGGKANEDLGGMICLATVGLGLIWLIVAAIMQNTAIRPTEITDDRIILTGVCEEFDDAMREDRERERDREAERRRSPRRSRSDDHRYRDRP